MTEDESCGCEPLHECVEPDGHLDRERWHCTACGCEWLPWPEYREGKA